MFTQLSIILPMYARLSFTNKDFIYLSICLNMKLSNRQLSTQSQMYFMHVDVLGPILRIILIYIQTSIKVACMQCAVVNISRIHCKMQQYFEVMIHH
jgi:hypothetical protein